MSGRCCSKATHSYLRCRPVCVRCRGDLQRRRVMHARTAQYADLVAAAGGHVVQLVRMHAAATPWSRHLTCIAMARQSGRSLQAARDAVRSILAHPAPGGCYFVHCSTAPTSSQARVQVCRCSAAVLAQHLDHIGLAD